MLVLVERVGEAEAGAVLSEANEGRLNKPMRWGGGGKQGDEGDREGEGEGEREGEEDVSRGRRGRSRRRGRKTRPGTRTQYPRPGQRSAHPSTARRAQPQPQHTQHTQHTRQGKYARQKSRGQQTRCRAGWERIPASLAEALGRLSTCATVAQHIPQSSAQPAATHQQRRSSAGGGVRIRVHFLIFWVVCGWFPAGLWVVSGELYS